MKGKAHGDKRYEDSRCLYAKASLLIDLFIETEDRGKDIDDLSSSRKQYFRRELGKGLKKALRQFKKHLKRCKPCRERLKIRRIDAQRFSRRK